MNQRQTCLCSQYPQNHMLQLLSRPPNRMTIGLTGVPTNVFFFVKLAVSWNRMNHEVNLLFNIIWILEYVPVQTRQNQPISL